MESFLTPALYGLYVQYVDRMKVIWKYTQIKEKQLTSTRPAIACVAYFTSACVRTHSITTHPIDVTAVRVGRTFVDI